MKMLTTKRCSNMSATRSPIEEVSYDLQTPRKPLSDPHTRRSPLAFHALLRFRNKALARGIDSVDIDVLLKNFITSSSSH